MEFMESSADPSAQLQALREQLQRQAEQEAAETAELQRQLRALAERLQELEERPDRAQRLALPSIPRPRPTRRQIGALLLGVPVGLALALGLRQALQPRSAPPAAAAAQLELEAGEPSWLEVRQLNGESVFVGELVGRRRFALGEGLQVLAGRPDLVRVQVGEAPDRLLGSVEQVEWQTFKPNER
ncbi:hypothetical protein KBY76_12475 [Synechococcus sp. GreenBA-s]|nr:hypothetical protein [Synechococcus sp. GreenBA-s]